MMNKETETTREEKMVDFTARSLKAAGRIIKAAFARPELTVFNRDGADADVDDQELIEYYNQNLALLEDSPEVRNHQ